MKYNYIIIFYVFIFNSISAQEFKIYQFSDTDIPVIDRNSDDWKCIPEEYDIDYHQLKEDEGKHKGPNENSLKVNVKVGWNEHTQKLYILYQAYDNWWRFSENSLNTDIFEVVVDGDSSRGPFIDRFHPTAPKDVWQAWFNFHGCHAQNYHIFTPAHKEDWCMLWGPQVWLKQKPWSDYAYDYSFSEGEPGILTLEFYITPFDHADANGPKLSKQTLLKEGNSIGLCWAIIDWDKNSNSKDGFWNLSSEHTMYGNADYLCKFKLMPKEIKQ